VVPSHVAGSLYGKNLITDTISTIGEQRLYNYALKPMSNQDFIEIVTADQPDTPSYFSYDAVLNTKERPTLDVTLERGLEPLPLEEVLALQRAGAQLLDTRDGADFEGAHLRGSLNVGLGGSYATWCGTILDAAQPVVVIAELGREQEAATRLGRIGFDNVAGHLAGGMQALDKHPELLQRTERVTAPALAELLGDPRPPIVLDVRSPGEWREKHIEPTVNVSLSRLAEQSETLPRERPIVVYCTSGYRSAIAASLLTREGFASVADLVGGLAAWESSSLPVHTS